MLGAGPRGLGGGFPSSCFYPRLHLEQLQHPFGVLLLGPVLCVAHAWDFDGVRRAEKREILFPLCLSCGSFASDGSVEWGGLDTSGLICKSTTVNKMVSVFWFFSLLVIDGLDFLKKENAGARDSIRYLEAEFKKGNR